MSSILGVILSSPILFCLASFVVAIVGLYILDQK